MKIRFVLVILCLFLLSIPIFAQETVEWGDYGLEFDVPDGYDIDDSGDNGVISIFSEDDALGIIFYYPQEDTEDFEETAEIILEDESFEDFGFDGDTLEIEVMGEDALQLPYSSDDWTGFLIIFPFDGQVFILDAYSVGDRLSNSGEDDLMEIVSSIRPTDGGNNNQSTGGEIETATDEDSTGEDIVEELVDLGLVEDGGDFLFQEDEVDEDSQDLSQSYEGGNIALGALVSFERADEDEEYRVCGFIAQSSTDDMDEEGTLLITGMDSDSAFVTFELDVEDIEGSIFEAHDSGVDVEDTNHILAIIQDDQLSAWVNGEMVVEEWELDLAAGDDELFAGFLADLGCEMTNVWAYTFE